MKNVFNISLDPVQAADAEQLQAFVNKHCGTAAGQNIPYRILKRSIDSRSRNIKVNLRIETGSEEELADTGIAPAYQQVSGAQEVVIVGAGPAGLFAALRMLELGLKPVILERGKNVRDRRRDLAAINKQGEVNDNSNYCFGEGGAGTYSDGKLYTRSTKRGDVEKILRTFVLHGADPVITVDAHPHIGTNKLPHIIVDMRETILRYGGEIHFNTLVNDLLIENGSIRGVQCLDIVSGRDKEFLCNQVILATGHSANHAYELLHRKNILLEEKTFAMGVRIEHSRSLIDGIQYHCRSEKETLSIREYLPAASYSLVQQVNGRGVYSFCMCPGGIIAPCATGQDEVVTNGWSPSKRNNPYSNSGIVVTVEPQDYEHLRHLGVMAPLAYRSELEKNACQAGGGKQTAPAQRMVDFIHNKFSSTLPGCSYQPGVEPVMLNEVLSRPLYTRLQTGLKEFGNKMRGYLTNEAILVGVETRTSSPLRIPRDKDSFQHPEVKGLYPCGEGAGYAGGIVSAAIDGQLCAEKIAAHIL